MDKTFQKNPTFESPDWAMSFGCGLGDPSLPGLGSWSSPCPVPRHHEISWNPCRMGLKWWPFQLIIFLTGHSTIFNIERANPWYCRVNIWFPVVFAINLLDKKDMFHCNFGAEKKPWGRTPCSETPYWPLRGVSYLIFIYFHLICCMYCTNFLSTSESSNMYTRLTHMLAKFKLMGVLLFASQVTLLWGPKWRVLAPRLL